MKNEILDNNFNSEIRNQLEVGEKVIWEEQPYQNRYRSIMLIVVLIFLPIVFFFGLFDGLKIILLSFLFSFSFLFRPREVEKIPARKNSKYLITNRRIVFQTRKYKTLHFQSIPFEDISYASVYPNMLGSNGGTIFLNIKKASSSSYIIKDIITNIEEDNRPTLKKIDNVKEVAKYIKMGIENKL